MIKRLAKLPYWEIIAIGVSTTVVAMIVLLGAAQWATGTWPQASQAVNMAYLILSAAVAWGFIGITFEAIAQRRRNKVISAAVDNIINLIMAPKNNEING